MNFLMHTWFGGWIIGIGIGLMIADMMRGKR